MSKIIWHVEISIVVSINCIWVRHTDEPTYNATKISAAILGIITWIFSASASIFGKRPQIGPAGQIYIPFCDIWLNLGHIMHIKQ